MRVGDKIGGREGLHSPEWNDTFDDGVRACLVALIDLHRMPPDWMSRRDRRRLRKAVYPAVFRAISYAHVNGFAGDPRPWVGGV